MRGNVSNKNGKMCTIRTSVFDWPYKDDFINALCHVDYGYYMYSVPDNNHECGINRIVYPERIFAYEFYHQYRRIMDAKNRKYRGVFLNGEQTKSKEIIPEIERFAPDLILHKKLDGMAEDSQLWLCEIKMKGSFNPLSDIEKFRRMDKLKFQQYIFLYAGASLQDFINKLIPKKRKGMIDEEHDGNVICLCSYFDDEKNKLFVDCHRLSTLIGIGIDKVPCNSKERVIT